MKSFKEEISEAVKESIAENPDLFLLDIQISPDNQVQVTIDGYKPVPLSECIRITREVESRVDRDKIDYALTVSTFDITQWFDDVRQFYKNMGRKMRVKTDEGETEGILKEIRDGKIILENKVREPKPVGKGKHMVIKKYEIPFDAIKKAKVIISF
jgi:ribosome maturation factor RimP